MPPTVTIAGILCRPHFILTILLLSTTMISGLQSGRIHVNAAVFILKCNITPNHMAKQDTLEGKRTPVVSVIWLLWATVFPLY